MEYCLCKDQSHSGKLIAIYRLIPAETKTEAETNNQYHHVDDVQLNLTHQIF